MKNPSTFNRKSIEERRKELRTYGAPAEAVLWSHLRKRQMLRKKFRRQERVGPFAVDFYCPDCNLFIELDGAPHDGFLAGGMVPNARGTPRNMG